MGKLWRFGTRRHKDEIVELPPESTSSLRRTLSFPAHGGPIDAISGSMYDVMVQSKNAEATDTASFKLAASAIHEEHVPGKKSLLFTRSSTTLAEAAQLGYTQEVGPPPGNPTPNIGMEPKEAARKSKSSIPIASESAEVINLRNTLKKSRSLLDTSNNSDASRGLLAPSRSIMGTYRKNRKKAPSWSPGKAEGGKPPKVMSDCNAFSEFQDEYPDSATKSWRGRMSRLTLKKGKSSPQLRDDAMKQQTAALSSQQHRHTYSIMGWVRGHNKDPLPQTESDNESALPQSTTNGTGPMIGYPLDKYFAELFQQDLAEPEPLFAVGSATVISETPSVEMPGQGTDELQRQRILQLATSAFGCENWESFETLFDETFLKLKLELDKDEVLYR